MRTVILLVGLFFSEFLFSQTQRSSLGLGTEYNQQDLCIHAGFSKQNSSWEISGNLGVGVNRTIFQQRLFPKIQFQGTFRGFQFNRFEIGPSFTMNYALLRVNATVNHWTHYQYYGAGYQWIYGNKFQVVQSTYFCRLMEHSWDTFNGRYTTASKWIFSIQIGGRYAF